MGDFGTPVVNASTAFNPTQTLSQILNVQSKQLGIQQQEQALQGQAAQVQQEQQTARQRAGVAAYMQDFDLAKHTGPDGTVDLDSVLTDPGLRKAAGDQFPDIVQKMIGIKQGQLNAKQQLVNLNDSTRTQLQSMLGGLRTDPDVVNDTPNGRQKVDKAIGQFSASGPDAARIAQIYGPIMEHVRPGNLAQTLSNIQLQAMDASTQASKQAPNYLNTGSQAVNVAPQSAGGPLTTTPTPQMQLAPQIITSPTTGGPAVVGGGNGTTPRPIGGGGGAAPGSGNAWQPPAGLPEIKTAIESARQLGDQVGVNRNINQRILNLARDTTTGSGTNFLHQAAATAGLPSGASYQELGAFLDRQAAMASSAMGLPNTNMGIETAKQFTGNTNYNNTVIADKTKFVDALNTAAGAYRAGIDRVVGTGPNPNYGAFQQFRSNWAQNFDPQVFAYENAVKSGDKEEQQKIEKDEGRKGMAELYRKRQALLGLANGQQ